MSILLLFVALCFSSAQAHFLDFGPCPKVDAMENVDLNRFLGQWYILHRANVHSKCLKDYLYINDEGNLKMTLERTISNDFVDGIIANLTSTLLPTKNSAILKIQHNALFLKSTMRIMVTDYDSYALIFKCMPMAFFHRWSASILVRDMNYNNTQVISQLFARLESEDLDTNKIFPVDHSSCVSVEDANLAISFDGDELSGGIEGKYVDALKDTIESFGGGDKSIREEERPVMIKPVVKQEQTTVINNKDNEIET